jgi:hypothetical protein
VNSATTVSSIPNFSSISFVLTKYISVVFPFFISVSQAAEKFHHLTSFEPKSIDEVDLRVEKTFAEFGRMSSPESISYLKHRSQKCEINKKEVIDKNEERRLKYDSKIP